MLLYLHLKDGVIGFYRRNKLGMASCQFPGWGGGIDHGMAALENRPKKCKEMRYHPDILMLQNIGSNFGTEGYLTDFAQVSWFSSYLKFHSWPCIIYNVYVVGKRYFAVAVFS